MPNPEPIAYIRGTEMSDIRGTEMSGITDEDVAEAQNYEVLGPGYFAARRVAEKLMAGTESAPLQKVAEKVTQDICDAVYEYCEDHLRSDLESNLQSHLQNMLDDTVKALLTGEQWAMNRYPLSQQYDAVDVRAAIAKHGGEPLLMARIADLEKRNGELTESLKWERERRY
jgi:hypothetical protein